MRLDRGDRDGEAAEPAHARALAWSIVALALIVAAVTLYFRFKAFTWDVSDDATYLRYARRVSHQGLGVFPRLFRTFVDNPEYAGFPPPSRVLHTLIAALFALIFGDDMRTMGYVSATCHLALIPVGFLLARRVVGELNAALISLSLGLSPLLLAMSATALSDSCAMFFAVTAVWFFLRWLERPRALWPTVALIVAFWFALAAKELSVFLLAPLALCAWLDARRREDGARLRDIAVAFVTPCVLIAATLILAAGGIAPLYRAFNSLLSTAATSPYGKQVGSGPWFRYLLDLMMLSPWVTLLCLFGVGMLLIDLGARRWDRTAVCCALLLAGLLLEGNFFTKNIRFLLILELPTRCLAIATVAQIARMLAPRRAWLVTIAAIALLAVLDCVSFGLVFRWIYDPVTPELLRLSGILVQ